MVDDVSKSKVFCAECHSYEPHAIKAVIERSFDELGVVMPRSKNVLIKPNLLIDARPKDAVTTHPAMVEAVCMMLKERGCKIIIADSSGMQKRGTVSAFESSGIREVAARYNAKCVAFEKDKKETIRVGGEFIEDEQFGKSLLSADYVINMPKMKTHSLMLMTCAVKNVFGYIPGSRKQYYHVRADTPEKFARMLKETISVRRPDINIVDGIVGLEGNGPGKSGTPRKAGLVIVGKDAFAVDKAVSDMMGFARHEVATNMLSSIEPEIIGHKPGRIGFRRPMTSSLIHVPLFQKAVKAVFKYLPVKPHFNLGKCSRCNDCVTGCPQKAIKLDSKKYPKLIQNKCISCFYCHEVCKCSAISLRRHLFCSWQGNS